MATYSDDHVANWLQQGQPHSTSNKWIKFKDFKKLADGRIIGQKQTLSEIVREKARENIAKLALADCQELAEQSEDYYDNIDNKEELTA